MGIKKSSKSSKLAIIGVDDPVTKRHNLETAVNNLPEEIPRILLSHSPEIINDAINKKIDLMLAGHTHGGQIFLVSWFKNYLTWLGLRIPRFISGYHKLSNTSMYVNRGIGTSIFPIRLGVRPEITVIQFE